MSEDTTEITDLWEMHDRAVDGLQEATEIREELVELRERAAEHSYDEIHADIEADIRRCKRQIKAFEAARDLAEYAPNPMEDDR